MEPTKINNGKTFYRFFGVPTKMSKLKISKGKTETKEPVLVLTYVYDLSDENGVKKYTFQLKMQLDGAPGAKGINNYGISFERFKAAKVAFEYSSLLVVRAVEHGGATTEQVIREQMMSFADMINKLHTPKYIFTYSHKTKEGKDWRSHLFEVDKNNRPIIPADANRPAYEVASINAWVGKHTNEPPILVRGALKKCVMFAGIEVGLNKGLSMATVIKVEF
jgi:hypothetical protein